MSFVVTEEVRLQPQDVFNWYMVFYANAQHRQHVRKCLQISWRHDEEGGSPWFDITPLFLLRAYDPSLRIQVTSHERWALYRKMLRCSKCQQASLNRDHDPDNPQTECVCREQYLNSRLAKHDTQLEDFINKNSSAAWLEDVRLHRVELACGFVPSDKGFAYCFTVEEPCAHDAPHTKDAEKCCWKYLESRDVDSFRGPIDMERLLV